MTDYRMQHTSPGPGRGQPLHDIHAADGGYFGPDVHEHPENWGLDHTHPEALAAARRVKGKPNATVTVYRAQPHGHTSINTGDWVSTSAQYAREHGMHHEDETQDMPVVKATVPARHVYTEGDLMDLGYHGPQIDNAEIHYPGGIRRIASFADSLEMRAKDLTERMGGVPTHMIEAHHPEHGKVGEMYWHSADYSMGMGPGKPRKFMYPAGLIRNIVVSPVHKRKGVGTAMWNHAKTITPELHHSTNQSEEGAAWAAKTAGAEGDAHRLRFGEPEEEYSGGSKWPNEGYLRAHHPEYGEVGHVQYLRGSRVNSPIRIKNLRVDPDHQRKGYGSALMDQLQATFPKARIDHGDRTDAGKSWWDSYGKGKADNRGRTSALVRHGSLVRAAVIPPEERCPTCKGTGDDPAMPGSECIPCDGSGATDPEFTQHTAGDGGGSYGRTIQAVQSLLRTNHPDLYRRLPPDADGHAQRLLGQLGHPRAREAFIVPHRDPGARASATVFDEDGAPGIALHPERRDLGTLAHECAHHMDIHESGMDPHASHSDEEKHGPGFVQHYQNALDLVHPEAGQFFAEHYPKVHRTLSRWSAFTPTRRIFGPTHGLDHRLWEGDHLKHDVSNWVLDTLNGFWEPLYGPTWHGWARVYFAGSEASEWTSETLEGNNDFDVLVGVHYAHARAYVPAFVPLTDEEITAHLNEEFRAALIPLTDPSIITIEGQPEGPFSVTWYCNLASWDIRDIKPYAAYNVSADTWAVRPPHLPDWSIKDFPPAMVAEARAVQAYVEAVLALPEPMRSQQADALWRHLHGDRSRAFSPQGEGWWDPGNALEKWLSQVGEPSLWDQLAEAHFQAVADPQLLLAPVGWSNNPASVNERLR